MDDSRANLHAYIERSSRDHHIEYKGFYSNHLSHVLIAEYELGASEARLQEYYDLYCKGIGHPGKLEPFVPAGDLQITEETWKDHWGSIMFGANHDDHDDQPAWYSAYREFFTKRVHKEGLKETISKYLPTLASGLSGAALHALIHLGWGVYIKNDTMVIDGLAYACYSYLNLEDPTAHSKLELSPIEILQQVHSDHTFDNVINKKGFQSTMLGLTNSLPLINKYASAWKFGTNSVEDTYKEIVHLVVSLYYATGSSEFFLLHGMTASFGIKFILPLLKHDDQIRLLQMFWLILVVVYISRGRPPLQREIPEKEDEFEDWSTLSKATTQSQDEHKIKVVFVCKQFSTWYPEWNQLFFKTAQETLRNDNN